MAIYEEIKEYAPITTGDISPGDIVAVNHDRYGRQEGLVVGSSIDFAGRQILQVQLEATAEIYQAWYPTVTRVRRTVSYTRPVQKQRTVERTVERRLYW